MDSKAESQDASQHIVMMLFDHILVVPMAGNARKSDVERVESATAITKWLEKVTGTMRDKSGVKAEVMWDRFTTLYVEKKSNSCTELLLSNALNKFEHKDMVYTINQLVELMYRLKLVACEAVVNSSVLNYLVPYIYLMERSCDDSKNALDLTLAASKMCDILTFSSGNALERLICHYRLDSVFLWSWYKHEDIRVRTHALSATTGITAEGGAYVLRYFSDHQLRKHLIQESAKMSKVATAKRKDLTDTERHYCVELVELTLTLFVLHNDGVAKLNAKPNVYRPILDLALALLQFVDVPTTHHHSLKSKEVDAALVKHSATFVKVSDGHRMDSAFCLLAFALDKLAWPLDVQKELATPAVMHLATRIICSNVRRFGLVRGAFRIMGAATSSHALSQHTLMPTRLSKSNLLVRTRDWIDMMVRARQDPLMLSAEQARDQVEIFHRIFFFLSNAIVVDCDSVIKSGVLDSALAFMPFVDNRQDIYDSFINSLSNLLIQAKLVRKDGTVQLDTLDHPADVQLYLSDEKRSRTIWATFAEAFSQILVLDEYFQNWLAFFECYYHICSWADRTGRWMKDCHDYLSTIYDRLDELLSTLYDLEENDAARNMRNAVRRVRDTYFEQVGEEVV